MEWFNPHPCNDPAEELESDFANLHNCFWHNWGSLMQQGSDLCPRYFHLFGCDIKCKKKINPKVHDFFLKKMNIFMYF